LRLVTRGVPRLVTVENLIYADVAWVADSPIDTVMSRMFFARVV
jgi:DNA-directed RNA polymerase specialized sigma24 family protein